MLTILGIKVSYETLVFFALFIGSEVLATSKLKSNSFVQLFLSFVSILKAGRREDDTLERLKRAARGG